MENSGASSEIRTDAAVQEAAPVSPVKTVIRKINTVINNTGMVLYYLRKIVMAVPVVYAALKIASYNREHLPEQVGLNLQSTGEFAQYISRNMAVMGPLALTIACLFLMFCSRKAMYPWAISIFTLVLPLLILVSNLYPA